MRRPRLSPLELQIMDALWTSGPSSAREIQERVPAARRPAYTTVQTILSRLEGKKAVRRMKKVGNALVFEALVSRPDAERRLVDDLLSLFGGSVQPVVLRLVETGKLTLKDVKEAEQLLRKAGAKK